MTHFFHTFSSHNFCLVLLPLILIRLKFASCEKAVFQKSLIQNDFPVNPSTEGPSEAPTEILSSDDQVNQILNNNTSYNARIRPKGFNGTGPTVVLVNIFLRSIDMIDDIKMEYRIQTTIRQEWQDSRLKFQESEENETVTIPEDSSRLWTPDLFFMNEKQASLHSTMKPNIMIRVTPEGQILLSTRISLTLSCPMSLQYYPLDKQTCTIRMGSYSWSSKQLVFIWKQPRSIQLPVSLDLARFTMTDYSTDYCNHKTTTGEYSCIFAAFTFRRQLGYYMIQNFLPCGMIVMVSWISFWLGASTIDARVSLGITTMLTMVAQIYGINQSVPPVSYTKALDVWTGSCLMFIVMAIIEVSIVGYNVQLYKYKKSFPLPFANRGINVAENGTGDDGNSKGQNQNRYAPAALERSQRIDFISRILFPVSFLLFNIAYWYAYMFSEKD